ncbi:hypothetical protein [Hydrogenophaga sp. T2]|uniref:hypothetical protein n=1 Tax=Hydrogenophaga sp. T2 TaxID=3132823 RepID=UPI003CEBF336
MKTFPVLSALALSLALSACGGGGGSGGGDAHTPATPSLSLTEFTGVWRPDATGACAPSFAYNPAYSSRLRSHTITATSGDTLDLKVTIDLFTDTACAVPKGVVEEGFTLPVAAVTLPSRANAIRGQALFISSHSSAVDGNGISLTRIPDGSAAGLGTGRLLADVQDSQLFLTPAVQGVAVDGAGYPLALDPARVFVH